VRDDLVLPEVSMRLVACALIAFVTACPAAAPKQFPPDASNALRPTPHPVESTSVRLTRSTNATAFADFAGKIFGDAANGGDRLQQLEFSPGYFISVDADDRTPDQVDISLFMTPSGKTDKRLVTKVPASFAVGKIFLDTVAAAFAQTATIVAGNENMDDWELDYTVRSAMGGTLTLAAVYASSEASIELTFASPTDSLEDGKTNSPALVGQPFETVGGTVWFSLTRDEFDFFSHRAYGVDQGAEQNFNDFLLHPHDWLRLTVTPQYALKVVDVAFEVVTVDNRRVPLAKAPASYVAGEQFGAHVERLADNMIAAEKAQPGSSKPWTAPFIYSDPDGGGSVEVRAVGEHGQFRIAYAVESPASFLQDVAFVPFLGKIDLPTGPPKPQACGSASPDGKGKFVATFSASSTVAGASDLKAPLEGNVWGSVFKSSDVTVLGPNDGAQAVANFFFPNVDVRDPKALAQYTIETELPFGDYQILGFMDIDHNADPNAPNPDTGDPVMIPIGGYKLSCGVQPVNVQFAILLPPGQ
jgi:hypothetical protein